MNDCATLQPLKEEGRDVAVRRRNHGRRYAEGYFHGTKKPEARDGLEQVDQYAVHRPGSQGQGRTPTTKTG